MVMKKILLFIFMLSLFISCAMDDYPFTPTAGARAKIRGDVTSLGTNSYGIDGIVVDPDATYYFHYKDVRYKVSDSTDSNILNALAEAMAIPNDVEYMFTVESVTDAGADWGVVIILDENFDS